MAHRGQRRLGFSLPVRQAEVPVVHVLSARIPVIGPGKHESAGATRRKRGSDLPVEHLGLPDLTLPAAIESDFRHEQGPISRQGLQARQVSFKVFL